MIKTIKVKKQLRLDELIKYIFDNGIKDESFLSDIKLEPNYEHKNKVYVHTNGTISLGVNNLNRVTKDDMYTVEVEEGITDDTDFEDITVVFESNSADVTGHFYNSNLKKIKKAENLLSAYIPINGKLELIWEADSE